MISCDPKQGALSMFAESSSYCECAQLWQVLHLFPQDGEGKTHPILTLTQDNLTPHAKT